MTRKDLIKALTSGLVRYVIHTPLSEYLTIGYERPGAAAKPADAWDSWVVSFNLQGYVSGRNTVQIPIKCGRRDSRQDHG